jgi:hypothetical protein
MEMMKLHHHLHHLPKRTIAPSKNATLAQRIKKDKRSDLKAAMEGNIVWNVIESISLTMSYKNCLAERNLIPKRKNTICHKLINVKRAVNLKFLNN